MKTTPQSGRGFHSGRFVKYHGKYATTVCFALNYPLLVRAVIVNDYRFRVVVNLHWLKFLHNDYLRFGIYCGMKMSNEFLNHNMTCWFGNSL